VRFRFSIYPSTSLCFCPQPISILCRCENHIFGVNFNEMYEIKITKTIAFLLRCFLLFFCWAFFSQVFFESKGLPLRNWVHSVLKSQPLNSFLSISILRLYTFCFHAAPLICAMLSAAGRSSFAWRFLFLWRVTSNLFFHGGYIWDRGGTSLWFPYKNCFFFFNFTLLSSYSPDGWVFVLKGFDFSFSSIFSRSCPRIRCRRPCRPRSRRGSSHGCRGRPKHLLSPSVCCPRRCSWSRRILPGVVVRTLRMRPRWRRRWCCRASTWPTLDPLECQTVAPSHRRYQSRRHNR